MTVLTFAALFGMSIKEMCELTGLSKEHLSEIVSGNDTVEDEKKCIIYHSLKNRADEIWSAEVKEAEAAYQERVAAIERVVDYKIRRKRWQGLNHSDGIK